MLRRVTSPIRRFAARFGSRVSSTLQRGQGVLGVTAVAAGTYLLAGPGLALIVLGGFLLLGAWAAR